MVAKNACRSYAECGLRRRDLPLAIAAALAAWSPAWSGAAAGESVRLNARSRLGEVQQVATVVEVEGELTLNSDGQKVRRLPMKAKAELRYAEQFLPQSADAEQRTVRHYSQARTAIRIQESEFEQVLRDDRRLIIAKIDDGPTLYSPTGPLTREELELIDTAGNSACLDLILPGKSIGIGEKWKLADDAVARLVGLEAIGQHDVTGRLDKIEDGLAIIHLAGKISGAIGGISSEIDVEGQANFHLQRKTVSWLAIQYQEKRAIGHAQPGYEATIRVRVQTEPGQSPPDLSDQAIASLAKKPVSAQSLLEFQAEKAGVLFLQDRRWQVMVDRFDTVILRLVDRGDLVAQCNLTRLAPLAKGQQLSLAAFQDDVSQTLSKNSGQIADASQFETAGGLRALKITVVGSASELPIQWMYYHISNGQGHRATLVFTMEGKLVERFGRLDRDLIDSLKLSPTPLDETKEPTPAAGNAKSARGSSGTKAK